MYKYCHHHFKNEYKLLKKLTTFVNDNKGKHANQKNSRIMVFNAIFNNISVLLVEETAVDGEKPPTCRKSLTKFIT